MNKKKKLGQVYTPSEIIENILNEGGYVGEKILKKHVIDNSAGNGEFLLAFIKRYVNEFWKFHNEKNEYNKSLLSYELNTYIHGIEIDPETYIEINNRIDIFFKENDIEILKNNKIVILGDTLKNDEFNESMDFVFGNPPYVRRRNIININDELIKKYSLKGNIDLYLLFFLKGMEMLKQGGTLGYITPNSFFTTASGKELRNIIKNEYKIKKIINLGHENPFKNIVNTYTAISILKKEKSKNSIQSILYKENFNDKFVKVKLVENIFDNFYFNLSNCNEKILITKVKTNIRVKNGAATCADWFFYNDNYDGYYIKDAFKVSTQHKTKVFFPYDENAKLIILDQIKHNNNSIYEKLINNEQKLNKRSLQKQKWYEFGRTQGIHDFLKKDCYTMTINNLVKTYDDLKINYFDNKKTTTIFYSGYYIQSEKKKDLLDIENLLRTDEFINYVKVFNKQKSGKYYSFTSRELEQFINYKIYEKRE